MDEGRERDEIVITPEMITAGVYALSELTFTADLQEVVRTVYIAMELERSSDQDETSET